jgi:hypothetical protein
MLTSCNVASETGLPAAFPEPDSLLRNRLHPRLALVDHERVHRAGGRIADVSELVNRTARVVPGLPGGNAARLAALDAQLDGPLDPRVP